MPSPLTLRLFHSKRNTLFLQVNVKYPNLNYLSDLYDLKPGMELMGTVRNVIDFGAFVDIGVHEDGLVHISQMCDRYIKHPLEVVKVGAPMPISVASFFMPIALTFSAICFTSPMSARLSPHLSISACAALYDSG